MHIWSRPIGIGFKELRLERNPEASQPATMCGDIGLYSVSGINVHRKSNGHPVVGTAKNTPLFHPLRFVQVTLRVERGGNIR